MTKINKIFAESLYVEEIEISKEIQSIKERQHWAWEVPFSPGWITREFKAYTSGAKWSIYRMGLRLSDMTLSLDAGNSCWQPTSTNFNSALNRAFSSIMEELNEHHHDALQRVLNHRFSTLVLNLNCGCAKVHGKWLGQLNRCWLGDYLLAKTIEDLGLYTLRLDLRGCILRDLLRNRGEALLCIAQESLAFHKGHPQERMKKADMEAGFREIYIRSVNQINEERRSLSVADMQTCLPNWIQGIQKKEGWCNSFLKSLRAEILDLSLEDIKNAVENSTVDSFIAAYHSGYSRGTYSHKVDRFKDHLVDLLKD